MPTDPALLNIVQWLSPGYPVGAYTYSHGLEAAVEAGTVTDAASFSDWAEGVLDHGAGRADAILFAASYRAGDAAERAALDALARALAPSAERLLETAEQGAAFARTTGDILGSDLTGMTYPVAVGAAARHVGADLPDALRLFVHAFAANLVSAATRLVPLGQTAGQRALHDLHPLCEAIALAALDAGPDDIGSCAFAADIASMRHETLYSRLFRS